MARQRYGQHFLKRQSILQRIAAAACPEPPGMVLEIGPGKGALTQYLLPRAARVAAVEIDENLVAYLRQKFAHEPKLTLIPGDVLQTDLTPYAPFSVAGNLPYYITSPIIEKLMALGPERMTQAVLLVQKEVAERITAQPGSRDYGYLSVQVQLYSEPKLLFSVPPGAFDPPPQVESAVVRLAMRTTPLAVDPAVFLQFAGRCFAQKRKTLRNNLLPYFARERIDALPEAGCRAEQLSVRDLQRVFDAVQGTAV